MNWEHIGYSAYPFDTEPINQETIHLYVGNLEHIKKGISVLEEKNRLLVVEGARGVGTTSFSNYLRFTLQKNKTLMTPRKEIAVDAEIKIETLLSIILANIIKELELFYPNKILKDKRFKEAKAVVMRISEVYRSFGLTALGFGISYNKSIGESSQPTVIPAALLCQHIEGLANLVQELGFKNGILIQLNNLDIGVVHHEENLKVLLNNLRNYFQTDSISWILVGDIGLRKFIAQEIDRLDDIVSYEILHKPLKKEEYFALIKRRLEVFSLSPTASFPVDKEVFEYLYDITEGRLRYIFGLIYRMISEIHLGDLVGNLPLSVAREIVKSLIWDRITRHNLNESEKNILKLITTKGGKSIKLLAAESKLSRQSTSKAVSKLLGARLIHTVQDGVTKHFFPALDAKIAYSHEKK